MLDPTEYGRGRAMTGKEHALLVSSLELAHACSAGLLYVELGVDECRTAETVMMALAALGGKGKGYIGIDLLDVERRWRERIVPLFDGHTPTALLLRRNSWELEGIDPAGTDGVAWCFVDACHCYACVSKDIAAWAPRIAPGGMLVFHDSSLWQNLNPDVSHPTRNCRYGVLRAIMDSEKYLEPFTLHSIVHGSTLTRNSGLMVYQRGS